MRSEASENNRERWAGAVGWKGYLVVDKKLLLEDRVKAALDLLGSEKAERSLDIGCSDGVLTTLYADKVHSSARFGVDVFVSEEARQKGIDVRIADLNSSPLPFQDSSFDCITMCETLEHLLEPEHALSETRRALKSGGFAVISVPRMDSKIIIISLILGLQPPGLECSMKRRFGNASFGGQESSGHLSHFTKKAFIDMVKESGFEIQSYREASISSGWKLAEKAKGRRPGILWDIIWGVHDIIPFKKDVMIMKIKKIR